MTDLQNDTRSLRSGAVAERGIITSAYIAIESVGVMPAYLAWLLRGYDHMKVFYSFGGGVRQSLTFADLKRLPTVLPPEGTQRRIADYLDRETATIDALIEKQRRMVRLLEERRYEAIADALNPARETDATNWWGSGRAHWISGQVSRLASVSLGKMLQTRGSNSDVLMPYLRAANVQPHGRLDLSTQKEMWFSSSEATAHVLRAGDVVVVEGGQGGFGRAAFLEEDIPGWGYQNSINRLRPHGGTDGRFLTYILLLARQIGYVRSICNVVSMPHFTAEKLARMPVPVVPMDEQREIADHLDRETAKIDALIAKAERFIELAQERRAALITAAVTGQIEIPTED
ncbi:restriction endonuclease subunit S [Micrococcus terreus]|uniref:restriction endonuclease subunit S n=1 Tax=Micrococcus terreus TaxID=574650 RepID=UPI0025509A9F|nr:restriction endonuclease subunit S [Micrococcus terreus]MDK7700632.1 restriction endonuclease subunit S [Micrococcus terreus]WOO97428.1 restriction endonuclease subunit S [Micrococcus terreus]